MKRAALKSGVVVTDQEIIDLVEDIDTNSHYLQLIIKAYERGVNKPATVISNFYKLKSRNDKSLEELTDAFFKAKSRNLNLSSEDILKLYEQGKPVSKIVNALIKADRHNLDLEISDISTLWYNDKQYGEKLTSLYVKIKKKDTDIKPIHLKLLVFNEINPEDFLQVTSMLKAKDLDIPFEKLINLLKKQINIIKAIKILSKAKKSCNEVFKKHEKLKAHGGFSDEEINRLSNIYIIEGKEKFKKALNKSLIYNNLYIDPVELYYDLTRSDGKGFKMNLEMIINYLGFEYKADIDNVTDAYLNARKNKLHIKYSQLAKMAEKGIDVKSFINAQIKNKKNE